MSKDTIYRQAAIDALKEAYLDRNIQSAKDDPCIVDAMTDWAIRKIKALPSEQPERYWIDSEGNISALPSAQPEQRCDTCRYRNLEWNEEPCDSCTQGGETNHYKPSAQPERKTGKWTEKEVIYKPEASKVIEAWQSARCDQCGLYHTTPYMYFFEDYNFCPICGADMRGEQDE